MAGGFDFLKDKELRTEENVIIQREINSLKILFYKIYESIEKPKESLELIEEKKKNIVSKIDELLNSIAELGELENSTVRELYEFINMQKRNLKSFRTFDALDSYISYFDEDLKKIISSVQKTLHIEQLKDFHYKSSKYIEILNKKIELQNESIQNFNQLIEKEKNTNTHDIYDLAVKKYSDRSYGYRVVFLVLIVLVVILVWFSAVLKKSLGLDQYDYWFFKITLAITSVTLITFYLKLSTKYQNIADQCEQTKLELEAFPSFVASFSTEDPKIVEIRKELALKYFGRDLLNNDKGETSNIITDQMKNTTELVKATTEAVKNLNAKTGGSSGSQP
ncbi:hypothetical protein [Acinetobacter sp. ANC 4173]|uniref:hypothetical protein n=1 Tax=Acinetobacter sp. ANC 4173 TaxID=2529837 RepID=UPI00103FF8F8|nr:hypothetical protein [Acinetobacter sp. ANC 4173]TCB81667.1 hypothetical protein E0H94_03875 [Acinetobacter sp. ANC 4173]